MNILCVEDDAYLLEDIALYAGGPGRSVESFSNAEDADARTLEQAFDVVVTDVNLPGMSGIDLARRLLERNPNQWIVVCTAYKMDRTLHALGPNVRAIVKDEVDALLAELLDQIEAELASASPSGAPPAPSRVA